MYFDNFFHWYLQKSLDCSATWAVNANTASDERYVTEVIMYLLEAVPIHCIICPEPNSPGTGFTETNIRCARHLPPVTPPHVDHNSNSLMHH